MRSRELRTPMDFVDAVTRLSDGLWSAASPVPSPKATRCCKAQAQCEALDFMWFIEGKRMCRAPTMFIPEGVAPRLVDCDGVLEPFCPHRIPDWIAVSHQGRVSRRVPKTRGVQGDSSLMLRLRKLAERAVVEGPPVVQSVAGVLLDQGDERALWAEVETLGFSRERALLEFGGWMLRRFPKE